MAQANEVFDAGQIDPPLYEILRHARQLLGILQREPESDDQAFLGDQSHARAASD